MEGIYLYRNKIDYGRYNGSQTSGWMCVSGAKLMAWILSNGFYADGLPLQSRKEQEWKD